MLNFDQVQGKGAFQGSHKPRGDYAGYAIFGDSERSALYEQI